jgi:hypothetical protein
MQSQNGESSNKKLNINQGIIQNVFVYVFIGFLALILSPFVCDNDCMNGSNQTSENPDGANNTLKKTTASILNNIGTAFLAGAVVTFTLDKYSRKNLRSEITNSLEDSSGKLHSNITNSLKDSRGKLHSEIETSLEDSRGKLHSEIETSIQGIQKATIDKLLEGYVGSTLVYEELSNYIIKRGYIIKDFEIKIRFEWHNKNVLKRKTTFSYKVKNFSGHKITYELKTYLEKTMINAYPGETKIESVNVKVINKSHRNSKENKNLFYLSGSHLKDEVKETDDGLFFVFKHDIDIGIDEEVECNIKSTSIEQEYDHLFLSPLTIADEMKLIVSSYPPDLKLLASAIHPNKDKFVFKDDSPDEKEWIIETGILPYQGIELHWKKKED